MGEFVTWATVTLLLWWLFPVFGNALYADAQRGYEARVRRSVAITPGNAWLGLFVETWDGRPPARWPYLLVAIMGRCLIVAVAVCVFVRS